MERNKAERAVVALGPCYGMNHAPPQIYVFKFQLPVPQNVTLFGNRVFADVIS